MAERGVRDALRSIVSPAGAARPAVGPEPGAEDALLHGVSRERVTGFAVAAVARGELALSAAGLDDLHERHERQLALDLLLERALVEVAAALGRAGIGYRALKGPMLAHTVYREPELRSFGDVDLLVPGAAFDDAVATLRPLGFERRFVEPRRGFDARFSKGASLERADGIEVDLHRTLAPGAFGVRLAAADFFARTEHRFSLAGHEIATVDRELAFTHACFHAALGDHPPRLVPLRDVVELAAARPDMDEVVALATGTRCAAVFGRAARLVETELGVRLGGALGDWARAVRPSRFDRWALDGYTRADRGYARQATASLVAMRRVRERAAYVRALAFPARDYVRARERGYTRRIARGAHLLRTSRAR